MANDIGDIVKKSKILLLDIEGTTTSISFVKDKLFPYAEENIKLFLENEWEKEDVREVVTALRKLALEDHEKSVEGLVTISGEDASKEDQIEGLVKNVKWQMASDRKTGPLKQLQGLIWKQGYDKGEIKGHIYDDVLPALEQWRSIEGQKIYIYSSGSVQAQKLLFGQSSAGNLLPLIDGHFDTAVGPKQEADSYKAIIEKIGCKPENILFLTDIAKEAEAARCSGINVALVSREGNAPLPDEATTTYPILHSFVQITATNKRKPDDHDAQEEQPAKVLKTDVEDNEKEVESSLKATSEVPESVVEVLEDQEKMEVEEEAISVMDTNKATLEEVPTNKETIIEEIMETNENLDAPSIVVTPILTEAKKDSNETEESEIMQVETQETDQVVENLDKETNKPIDIQEKVLVSDKTPLSTVTEIEEVSDDKEALSEMAEIIEDLQPVIEDTPGIEDIDELKNVGEVLEKECDEILSKVQDVTNLVNMPIKPLLNTISEESLETENIDSNDIVDRILETEMEMECKPFRQDTEIADIQEVTDTKIIAENKEITDKDKRELNNTENIITDSCKIDEKLEVTVEEKMAEKGPESKKESKMETVECQTEIQTESVGSQVNMMEEGRCIMDIDKGVILKEIGTNTHTVTEDELTLAKESKLGDNKIVAEKDNEKIEDKELLNADEKKDVIVSENVAESTDFTKTPVKENVAEKKENTETPKNLNQDSTTTEITNEMEVVVTKEVISEEVKSDNDVNDKQINGNTTNGETTTDLNGDASKSEELRSRLCVENSNEVVNGSKGKSPEEQGQGDNKIETEVSDIKVKTILSDDSQKEPIEQPTEA